MIRGWDDSGAMFIGFVRGSLVSRLLAGERVCLPGYTDGNGLHHPHVCLFLRDDNSQLMAATREYFPNGFLPGAALDHASVEEPK